MQSGGHQIWGWLEWAQDRQCYVVATRWLKIIEIFNDLCVVEYNSQGETISRAWPKRYLTSANEKLSLHFGLRKEGAMIGKFAQITSMWPFLSTSSSCMVGSSQAWFVTYKAFSCSVRNATGRTAAYIYRLTFHEYSVELDHSGYWILDLWRLYLHFTHHLVSREVAWYFQAVSLCILHHFVAPLWAQSNKCTMLT